MTAMAADVAGGASESFWTTAEFWVLVAFVLLLALVGRAVYRMITAGLDARAGAIRNRLEETRRLREDAQELLASYERKQQDSLRETEAILEQARNEAEKMKERGALDLEKNLKRREQLAIERIAQAEASALDEVRNAAVDLALAATRRVLADKMTKKTADDLIDAAIEDLPKKLH